MRRKKFQGEDKISYRVRNLRPYLFYKIAKAKEKALASGKELIDLGAGNPDLFPPKKIIETLRTQALNPENHRHPAYEGLRELRVSIAEWFSNRFGVNLNPEDEILILGGSKEGLGLIPWAILNPNEVALVPDPGYPIYQRAVLLSGGKPVFFPLVEENNWLPDLDRIFDGSRQKAGKVSSKSKLIFLNYPNNPTGAVPDLSFFQKLFEFAQESKIIVCHDMAYSEITYDGRKSHSFLEIKGAKEIGLEFFSFSKTYSMTGWRIGFAVGDKRLIDALREIKVTLSSGVFHLVQKGALSALLLPQKEIDDIRKIYQQRRDVLIKGLKELGWKPEVPHGAIFVWAKIPFSLDSEKMAMKLLEKGGILTTPGIGLGANGEGYIRFSLTSPVEKIKEALKRMKGIKF